MARIQQRLATERVISGDGQRGPLETLAGYRAWVEKTTKAGESSTEKEQVELP